MIDYIKGAVAELTPATVTVETHGIGYSAHISLYTFSALSGKTEVKLYIHEAIREDAFQLFGFFDKAERDLFLLLISVSGIGPGTARIMLSSMTASELNIAIASGDVDTLKTVKGIGIKTAQRIVIDLKDKIKVDGEEIAKSSQVHSATHKEAISALVMLGFTQQASQKAVDKIAKSKPNSTVEEVIKQALKIL